MIVDTINVVIIFGRESGYDLIINEGRISQNTILNGGTLYKGASVDITNDIAKVLEKKLLTKKISNAPIKFAVPGIKTP